MREKAQNKTRGALTFRALADDRKKDRKREQQEATPRDSPFPVSRARLPSSSLSHLATPGKALDLSWGCGRRTPQGRSYSLLFTYSSTFCVLVSYSQPGLGKPGLTSITFLHSAPAPGPWMTWNFLLCHPWQRAHTLLLLSPIKQLLAQAATDHPT